MAAAGKSKNSPQMTLDDIESIICQMVDRAERLVRKGRRGELLNERFWHHMFSAAIADWYRNHNVDIWESLILAPEHPTLQKFRRAEIRTTDSIATLARAIGSGKSGNLDFVIRSSPAICVEWKGPNLYSIIESVEVLLKLLTEDVAQVKVFAGIFTSSETGKRGHMPAAKKYLLDSIRFAKSVFPTKSLADSNVHLYLATIPNSGAQWIHRGPIHRFENPA